MDAETSLYTAVFVHMDANVSCRKNIHLRSSMFRGQKGYCGDAKNREEVVFRQVSVWEVLGITPTDGKLLKLDFLKN